MPGKVLRPAAAGSPDWVVRLVNFGAEAWTRHPTSAAASAVWIQLGIGMFLLVAPRGRWSRLAGLGSVAWGLVVWVFGEAFGAIFAPGLTVLFGAPGGSAVLRGRRRPHRPARPGLGGPAAGAHHHRLRPASSCAHGRAAGLARARLLAGGDRAKPGTLAGDGRADGHHPTTALPVLGRRLVRLVRRGSRLGGQPLRGGGAVRAGLALLSGRRRLLYPTLLALIVLGSGRLGPHRGFRVPRGRRDRPQLDAADAAAGGRVPGRRAGARVGHRRCPGCRRPRRDPLGSRRAGGGSSSTPATPGAWRRRWEPSRWSWSEPLPMVAASVDSRTDSDLAVAANGAPQPTAARRRTSTSSTSGTAGVRWPACAATRWP